MASIPLKNNKNFCDLADEWTTLTIEINELAAAHKTEMQELAKKQKIEIEANKKKATNIKSRLTKFSKDKGKLLFGGKETGTAQTELAKFSLKNNPSKIEQIDESIPEEELIELIENSDHPSVVITKKVISIEAMEKLEEEEINKLGFETNKTKKFSIEPLVAPDLKK